MVCVPTMLCVKPCVFGCCVSHHKDHHGKTEAQEYEMAAMEDFVKADNAEQLANGHKQASGEDEFNLQVNIVLAAGPQEGGDHGFGELMIH